MRVVLLCHGHPDYSVGGAEMATYSLYRALAAEDPDNTHLISWIAMERAPIYSPGEMTRLKRGSNEWLYHSEWPEGFYQTAASRQVLHRSLIEFLVSLQPDVVHFQHFMGFGIDAIRLARVALPRARIVFTLHEFLAICANDGQMVTRPAGRLCQTASPVRCARCFPERSTSEFALREVWFKRHFELVDLFIAPSEFLKERYVGWGIEASRIRVVENAQICTALPKPRSVPDETQLSSIFSFFGQINPYKGINVLLDAAQDLKRRTERAGLEVSPRILIYGSMSGQSPEFQDSMMKKIEGAGSIVEYRGGYEMHDVIELMSGSGWVVVPSAWWENSPVVIEEAFYADRPVICSNIGGMKEKVTHELNGLHFRARDPVDLSHTIERCLREPDLWGRLKGSVRKAQTLSGSAAAHKACYREIAHA